MISHFTNILCCLQQVINVNELCINIESIIQLLWHTISCVIYYDSLCAPIPRMTLSVAHKACFGDDMVPSLSLSRADLVTLWYGSSSIVALMSHLVTHHNNLQHNPMHER